jgi:bifunctional NMN adenylyltransferase/nudix hydrolase
MTNKKYDLALCVGRWEPYHNIHHKLLNHALTLGEHVLIVLGSAKSAVSVKNPFTPQMREQMIRACFDEETNKRLTFADVRDYPYHENKWISEIQNIVRMEQDDLFEYEDDSHTHKNTKVCLVGKDKDETTYYLKLFPQWTFEEFYDSSQESRTLNATDIRSMYLASDGTYSMRKALGQVRNASFVALRASWEDLVPEPVAEILKQFAETEVYSWLAKEYAFNQKYIEDSKFKNLPFKPTFVTTDAVVVCKGHVLVVRRGCNPGKGQLALPGGFLADGLTLKDNVIKELREETDIKLPNVLLKGLIRDQQVFDFPYRSMRGRTVTHGYYIPIDIKVEEGLPAVRGGDDAAKAFWLPLASLGEHEDQFFEDHVWIIRHFVGLV